MSLDFTVAGEMDGKEFRRIREEELGLTQAQLGKTMGMRQQAIQRIESSRGPTTIQAAFLRFIEAAVKRYRGR